MYGFSWGSVGEVRQLNKMLYVVKYERLTTPSKLLLSDGRLHAGNCLHARFRKIPSLHAGWRRRTLFGWGLRAQPSEFWVLPDRVAALADFTTDIAPLQPRVSRSD